MTDKPLASNFKSFISESEIEEKRKKRQEEWEKVRQPGQSIEAPEEVVDNRTLYERLQQQKDKKQEEYDESHKLKNQIRGLDNDEADFLSFVSDRQSEILEERYREEQEILKDFKKATEEKTTSAGNNSSSCSGTSSKAPVKASGKSQSELLSGAIKRKRSNDNVTDSSINKIARGANKNIDTPTTATVHQSQANKMNSNLTTIETSIGGSQFIPVIRNTDVEAKVVGYLPGIGDYSDDSGEDSEEDSSSGSDVEIKTVFPPIIRIKDVQKAMNQTNH